MNERLQLVSSDIATGNIEVAKILEDTYDQFLASLFNGIELIGWKPEKSLPAIIKQAKEELGIQVVTIHGPTGDNGQTELLIDRLKLRIIENWLIPFDRLMEAYSSEFNILVHSPVFHDQNNATSAVQNPNMNFLWIENHPTRGGLLDTQKQIMQLRQQGISMQQVGLMFDIAHYLRELRVADDKRKSLADYWSAAIRQLEDLLEFCRKHTIPIGFHHTIGTNEYDSIPKEVINLRDLSELADLMNNAAEHMAELAMPLTVVVENQVPFRQVLYSTRNERLEHIRTTENRLLELLAVGVLVDSEEVEASASAESTENTVDVLVGVVS